MRKFTKMGIAIASAGLPVMLWAGAAGAQSQSEQSPSSFATTPTTFSGGGGTGGTLARTGADDLLPLALSGAALAGAIGFRSVRRRSVT